MDRAEYHKRIAELFTANIPHCHAMGFNQGHVEEGKVVLKLEYQPFMLGNPEHGLVHGGVLTSLIDSAAGMAACSVVDESERVVTLDLRIDYLRPAVKEQTMVAEAECYRLTTHIAFIKAISYQSDPEKPVATGQATFMRLAGSPKAARADS